MVLWFYGSFLLFILLCFLIVILIFDLIFEYGCKVLVMVAMILSPWPTNFFNMEGAWLQSFGNYGNAIVMFLLQPLRFCKKLPIVSPYFGKL